MERSPEFRLRDAALECGDVSPLSPGATCRAAQSAVVPAHSQSEAPADSRISTGHTLQDSGCSSRVFIWSLLDLESGDVSPLSPGASRPTKRSRACALKERSASGLLDMNWPHAPRQWLFEPGI